MSAGARWTLSRREQAPGGWVFGVSLIAVIVGLLVTAGVFVGYGLNPVEAYGLIVRRTLLDGRGFSEVVRKSIPLLLAGVGLVLAFRAQFWNIGAEGQILAGAVGTAGVALFVPIPQPWLVPSMYLAGFLAGALWGLVPAVLKARLGVSEIITSLMLNYVALYGVRWLINGPWKAKSMTGFAYSERFGPAAALPMFGSTRVHVSTLIVGLAFVVMLWFILRHTRLGFAVRMLGQSPAAARYAGVSLLGTTVALAMLSAGAAGVAGTGEVAGIHRRLIDPDSISLGYGYTAILVALLARGNPFATVLTALFLGWVFAAGDVMKVSLHLPFQITGVLTGVMLLCVVAAEPLLRYRFVRSREP